MNEIPSHAHRENETLIGNPNWTKKHFGYYSSAIASYAYGEFFIDKNNDYYVTDVTSPHNTQYTGGGSAHSIMNPYLAVYMWKRTA